MKVETISVQQFLEGKKHCPRCKQAYWDYPALSRRDNKTYICPECGVLEAMEDFTHTEYTGEVYWEESK